MYGGDLFMSLKSILTDYGIKDEESLRFVLDQYGKIIQELSHNELSKLTYDANYLLEHFEYKFKENIKPWEYDGLPQDKRSIVFKIYNGDVIFGYYDEKRNLFINENKIKRDNFSYLDSEVYGWFYDD
jgi:hypothetical protein